MFRRIALSLLLILFLFIVTAAQQTAKIPRWRSQAWNNAYAVFEFFHQIVRQGTDILPERLVGDCDDLAKKKIAVAGNAALPFVESESENSRVFDEPDRGWNDDRRWIPRLIDKIRLEHERWTELSRFCFDARVEIDNVQVSALNRHLLTAALARDPGGENLFILFAISASTAPYGLADFTPQFFVAVLLFQRIERGAENL